MWTGWGDTRSPARDEQRLADCFGDDLAVDLLPLVRHLEDEFYESDAHLTASNLVEMGQTEGERFKGIHPELSDEAAKALAWCYMYDYK